MAIADKLTKLQSDISDAYTTIATKGGTVPTDKNTDSLANAIDSIPAGGGSTGDFRVRFYDCDGTILKEEWVDLGEDATPPEDPDYDPDRLTFRGWNHSYTNIQGDTACGALYTVDDHAIYYFFSFPNARTPNFQYINPNQEGTIDWGDGTVEALPVATSLTSISHAYSSGGNYIIKISGVSDYVDKIISDSQSQFLVKSYIGNQYVHTATNDCFKSNMANYGPNFYVFDSAIKGYVNGINGPKLIIYIMNDIEDTFNVNTSFTYIDNSNTRIVVNDNFKTNIGTGSSINIFKGSGDTFENFHQVQTINAGRTFYQSKYKYLNCKNVTSILSDRNTMFCADNNCLEEIYFEKITTIGQNSTFLAPCGHLKNIILNTENVVGKYNADYLTLCNGMFKIYVPDSLYNSYITDAKWSASAFRIKKMSELPTTSHFYRYVKNQINNE